MSYLGSNITGRDEPQWPCGEKKHCAGSGCQAPGEEVSPKSSDEPTHGWSPAIQGSSARERMCATHNSLSLGPFSAFTP